MPERGNRHRPTPSARERRNTNIESLLELHFGFSHLPTEGADGFQVPLKLMTCDYFDKPLGGGSISWRRMFLPKWSPDFELIIFAIDCSGTFRLGPSCILADPFEHLMTRTHWQAGIFRGSFRKVTWRIRAFVSRPHGGPAFVDGSVGYSACATTNNGLTGKA